MCGRYVQSSERELLRNRFGFAVGPGGVACGGRFNVAPRQRAPIVVIGPEGRLLSEAAWGLLPGWARTAEKAPRPINARAEGLAEKPTFRDALRKRRALVPVDGYYEWRAGPGRKTPFFFRVAGGGPFALAGLWETWRPADGREPLETFAIVTTEPNEVAARVHDRMPAVLDAEGEALWLSGRPLAAPELARCLAPAPAGTLEAWEVSPLVNDPSRNGPELLLPSSAPAP